MPHDHAPRIAELEAELAQIDADLERGIAEKSHADLLRDRSQVLRRIAQRKQDDEVPKIAAEQAAAAERAEYDRLHPREEGELELDEY